VPLNPSHRYFSTWKHKGRLEDHPLPPDVRAATGQAAAPFGDGALRCADALLAAETCEELFTPQVRGARDGTGEGKKRKPRQAAAPFGKFTPQVGGRAACFG
jgi:hypothetical protein